MSFCTGSCEVHVQYNLLPSLYLQANHLSRLVYVTAYSISQFECLTDISNSVRPKLPQTSSSSSSPSQLITSSCFHLLSLNTRGSLLILLPFTCPTMNPSASHVAPVFKTHSAPDCFSPPTLLLSSSGPSTFSWITAIASYRPHVLDIEATRSPLKQTRLCHCDQNLPMLSHFTE